MTQLDNWYSNQHSSCGMYLHNRKRYVEDATSRKWLLLSGTDTIVLTLLRTIESRKKTCSYPERTRMCPEHFLRWMSFQLKMTWQLDWKFIIIGALSSVSLQDFLTNMPLTVTLSALSIFFFAVFVVLQTGTGLYSDAANWCKVIGDLVSVRPIFPTSLDPYFCVILCSDNSFVLFMLGLDRNSATSLPRQCSVGSGEWDFWNWSMFFQLIQTQFCILWTENSCGRLILYHWNITQWQCH